MINESLTGIIRDHLSDIDDLNHLTNPRKKASQIEKIAEKQGKNLDSVTLIFNRELKKLVKKYDMNVDEFFPQRQTKKSSGKLDIKINLKPVQVDDKLSKTEYASSENTSSSRTTSSKINEPLETAVNEEDYYNIVRVLFSIISMVVPNIEEFTKKEEKTIVVLLKLMLGDKIKDPKYKEILGMISGLA